MRVSEMGEKSQEMAKLHFWSLNYLGSIGLVP